MSHNIDETGYGGLIKHAHTHTHTQKKTFKFHSGTDEDSDLLRCYAVLTGK